MIVKVEEIDIANGTVTIRVNITGTACTSLPVEIEAGNYTGMITADAINAAIRSAVAEKTGESSDAIVLIGGAQ